MTQKAKWPPKRRKSGNVHYGTNLDTYYKNLDNMKLLISYPEFQKAISETRKFLGIPENGFPKDGKLASKWTRELDINSDKIMNSLEFNKQFQLIKAKLFKGEIGMRMAEKQSSLLHHQIPWNYLKDTIKFLTDKFNVPENYERDLRTYIMYGIINAPIENFSGGEYSALASRKEVRYLPIKIYSRLTDSEIKRLKKYIDENGAHLPRFQSLTGVDKKLEIEEWFDKRERFDPVEQRYYKVPVWEIAKEKLGSKKKAKKAYDIATDIKKLRERRFGKHL